MPELPEVETLCRQLLKKTAGAKISAASVFDSKLERIDVVRGRVIQDVRRLGKTILLVMDNGQSIAIHLRMTGRLLWHEGENKFPHTRLRLHFAAANVDLIDARRFATVRIVPTPPFPSNNDLICHFDQRSFRLHQARRKTNIKSLLMDPNALAGIGNIYACEILHRAGISPTKRAAAINEDEWKKIFSQGRRILKKSIEKRGTSISDWRDLYGRPGENQHALTVYGQEGKACCFCGATIIRAKQGGRSTFYCPCCQK